MGSGGGWVTGSWRCCWHPQQKLLKMSAAGNPGYNIASSREEANGRKGICEDGFPITPDGRGLQRMVLCIYRICILPCLWQLEVCLLDVGGPWVGKWACIMRPRRESNQSPSWQSSLGGSAHLSRLCHCPFTGQRFSAKWKGVIACPKHFTVFREEIQRLKNRFTWLRLSMAHLP